ncbi:tat pathway signal sequence [Drepanopeziza brunnea f. sp. 'multigermtubi' MB_m1]|uniref:Tat pathway signal sequence n=1 Tax=Marssonina brunnea f. sp. multigermtubi (strain MB_m1) TaxID=1072389 RepID=K1Y9B6_MARBU|nr:tat pathway signal sequence [Drepanopeziza brunnea f. sp. 'multigermtubi' MB_m1]EKD21749.1 tat pathway signal sequence [Drepanopeziza brunnea f. sp. 'multigermtubi' MB_m1]
MAIVSNPVDLVIFSLGQILIASAALGFTAPGSSRRHVVIPILVTFTLCYGTIASYTIPQPFAAISSMTLCCCCLNYLSMAFLSSWSFEAKGPSARLAKKAKAESPQSEARGKGTGEMEATVLDRLAWGFKSIMSFRDVNTPFEVKNVPHFVPEDPSYVPTKPAFFVRSAIILAACYLIIDLIESRPPPSDAAEIFSADKLQLWKRRGEVTVQEVIVRTAASAGFWVLLRCAIMGGASAINMVLVALNSVPVESCRPIMGPISEAYTLRGFWGKFWTQIPRKIIAEPANYICDELFIFKKGTPPSTYAKIFVTFFAAGFLLRIGDVAVGIPLEDSRALQFFCLQAAGIMFEDAVQYIYRSVTGAKFGAPPRLWTRGLGYIWVVFFLLFLTTPWWAFPAFRMILAFPDRVLIPHGISIFKENPTT